MPVKHHPQAPFVRRVPTWKMHIFTFVQVCALAMLWAVKSSKFSLAFPFFLILMVPIRHQMERLFTPLELRAVNYFLITKRNFNLIIDFCVHENSLTGINQTRMPKMNQTSTSKLRFQRKQSFSIQKSREELLPNSMNF